MHKNIKLLGVLLLQLVVIGVLFMSNNSSSEVDYEPKLFAVSDTSSISKIILNKPGSKVELSNVAGTWNVNGQFEADKALMRVIKSVLNRLKYLGQFQ